MEDTGIEVELSKMGAIRKLEPTTEIAIFRIFQESLSNIRKHSQGSFVKIIMEYSCARFNLSIMDNGIGFNPEDIDYNGGNLMGGFGLMSIRERLELLGGKLQINSSPGKGTKLNMHIPLIEEDINGGQGYNGNDG